MDLRSVTPALNLYNRKWPLRTAGYSDAPAKFIFDQEGRRGQAIDSIVAGSTILSGGKVQGSVLGRGVRVEWAFQIITLVTNHLSDADNHLRQKALTRAW